MSVPNNQNVSKELKIVTVDSAQRDVLRKKTENFQEDEMPWAKEIAEKLLLALTPYLPAAGLAAPQIGISKSIFIYSYDRDPKNFEIVINPIVIPIGNEKIEGWEGCFSVLLSDGIWKLAKIPRYEKIKVIYINQNGVKVEKILDGFASKVFQHEYDHLQGIESIDRSDAFIKEFISKNELLSFLEIVKKDDSSHYKNPTE
jgi:peptide deformylase